MPLFSRDKTGGGSEALSLSEHNCFCDLQQEFVYLRESLPKNNQGCQTPLWRREEWKKWRQKGTRPDGRKIKHRRARKEGHVGRDRGREKRSSDGRREEGRAAAQGDRPGLNLQL